MSVSWPNSRRNNFDFVRLLAALCVLLSHQFALSGLQEPAVLGLHSLGGFGVLVFFTVSGYLVAQSWQADPHVGRFALRRFLRIWPGLAVVILLTALVWGPLVSSLPVSAYFRHPLFRDYLNGLWFAIRGMLPVHLEGSPLPAAVNGSLWTLPLEVRCYIALAFFGAVGLLRIRWVLAALVALVLAVYAVVEPRGDRLVAFFDMSYLKRYFLEFSLFFAAGTLLHYFDLRDRRSLLRLATGAVVAAAVAFAAGRVFLALWLTLPLAVLAFATASTPVVRDAARFGDLSYGVYLYAFPVQHTLIWTLGKSWSWGALLLLIIAVTAAFAFASWHLVEKRALRFKPRGGLVAGGLPPAYEGRTTSTRAPPRLEGPSVSSPS